MNEWSQWITSGNYCWYSNSYSDYMVEYPIESIPLIVSKIKDLGL